MTASNRFLNRLVLLVTGAVLIALGLGAIVVVAVPSVRRGWDETAPGVAATVSEWFQASRITGTELSWWWVIVLAVLLLAVILLLVFALRHGGGHTGTVIRQRDPSGAVVVNADVAEKLLEESLSARTDLIASRVSTYRVRRTPVLKLSLTLRRGVSPTAVVEDVQRSLAALDRLVGAQLPAFIQLSGGFRARVARPTRLE